MTFMKHIKQQIVENVDRVSDKEATTKFKDLDDRDLDNDGDSDSTDKYLHKRLGKVAKVTENAYGVEEPYYIEVSVRDARKAIDAIKDMPLLSRAMRSKDLVAYGTNVFATEDEEILQAMSDIFNEIGIEMTSNQGLDEMNVTGNVAGYDTPKAFGSNKRGEDAMKRMGYKTVKDTDKYFVPMESKMSNYKKMMSEMYRVNIDEAIDPEMERVVRKFVEGIQFKYRFRSRPEAMMAIFDSFKRHNYIHSSVEYKAPSGVSIKEGVSYHEYKNDESASPRQKVNKSIVEINKRLMEVEKIISHNIRLKTESGVNSNQFWKRSANTFAKISERLNRINNKLKELGK